jgi:hypothetical protein
VHKSEIVSEMPPNKGWLKDFFQPSFAWIVTLGLVITTILGVLAGAGKILNLAFPVAALGVGIYLYFRAPILYNGFTWWVWILTPFLRRIIDFRIGYTEPSPILLAPFFVTGVSIITLVQQFPNARRFGGVPFIMAIGGVLYGFLIGLINIPSTFQVIRQFLDWFTPLTFGFHLSANWRNFPNYYKNTQRVFVYGTLVTGLYGVFQYLTNPGWDVLWMVNSGQGDYKEGEGFRVFSTMQSIEPFTAFMAAGLLMLFTDRGLLRFPASAFGYLSFLLTLGRSAWLGWLGGLMILISSLKAKHQMRLFVVILLMSALAIPVVTSGPFSEKISGRIQTLSDVKNDNSFQGRQENMIASFERDLFNVLGSGIGLGLADNAFLGLFFSLGWIGVSLYVSALVSLSLKLFLNSENKLNLFSSTARAIVASCLIRMPANSTSILGVGGVILWGFLGLTIASQKHYQEQLLKIPMDSETNF